MASRLSVGVISDTHGLMRPDAIEELRCARVILHAGDVGDPQVLRELGELAPVIAVRGNVDVDPWARALPERRHLELGGVRLLLLHDRAMLGPSPAADGLDVVVFGHSHKAMAERRGGVLWFNPGSAGPGRFDLRPSVGLLEIENRRIRHRLVPLRAGQPPTGTAARRR